jgi:hypothetical protein
MGSEVDIVAVLESVNALNWVLDVQSRSDLQSTSTRQRTRATLGVYTDGWKLEMACYDSELKDSSPLILRAEILPCMVCELPDLWVPCLKCCKNLDASFLLTELFTGSHLFLRESLGVV